eukprot:CAMPEP_0174379462 /NCGR_PEP_ID=MMETSP0811_2-20130205/122730_1 /TAXON_ID=73025 ORGANISM="Eutreptiella gymnastica-like, Strain CCMP1594" /NCGR_SAMPLE_ID=MMETSP0811_2 /ASSEMBLY_ACC=CAM_ASM_000667 /LENGTH=63 /DNA_ID=CAMNT_0015532017 /DNA_START=1517 /DNA_END=1708 /DNA_ORIENTATION=-
MAEEKTLPPNYQCTAHHLVHSTVHSLSPEFFHRLITSANWQPQSSANFPEMALENAEFGSSSH